MRLLIFYYVIHYLFKKIYQTMELKHSLSTVPVLLYHWSHAHLLTELVKRRFSASTWTPAPNTWGCSYHSWFSVHGCNISASWVFLTCSESSRTFPHLSVDFSFSTWVQSSSGSCLYFWFSWAYHSSSKEEYSSKHNDGEVHMRIPRIPVHRRTRLILILPA